MNDDNYRRGYTLGYRQAVDDSQHEINEIKRELIKHKQDGLLRLQRLLALHNELSKLRVENERLKAAAELHDDSPPCFI
jgi:hypothetical protein